MKNQKNILIAVIAAIVIFVSFFINYQQNEKIQREKKQNQGFNVGVLSYLGIDEKDFQKGFDDFRNFADKNDNLSDDAFINSIVQHRRIIHFYNSLMALIMDLKSGKLDEIILPESVGRYLIKNDSSFRAAASTDILSSGVSFGFNKDSVELQKEINAVLAEMKADGTLQKFSEIYITNKNPRDPAPIRPAKIKNAPEIKIAVTGDMPPIDMFAGDGNPTGYNTAVLAELSKRLNKNIKFINTDAGGRSAALMSGRADAVFWYRVTQSSIEGDDPFDNLFKDVPEGVILSLPYYSWKNEIIIRLNNKRGLF